MKILTENGKLTAKFIDKNPITARAIESALPFQSRINKWGEEIYFEIPVKIGRENPQKEVEVGDVAYWAEGRAMCIFCGKTPASNDDEPVAYSPVNVFARIDLKDEKENLNMLKETRNGSIIRIERCD
jgi:hypothetical protein